MTPTIPEDWPELKSCSLGVFGREWNCVLSGCRCSGYSNSGRGRSHRQLLRSPSQIGQVSCVGIEPQPVVQRGEDLTEVDWAVGDFGSQPVGRSDDLSRAEPSARE